MWALNFVLSEKARSTPVGNVIPHKSSPSTPTVLIFQAMAVSEQIGYPDHILEEENEKLDEEYAHVWTAHCDRQHHSNQYNVSFTEMYKNICLTENLPLSPHSWISVRRTTLRIFWRTWQHPLRKVTRSWERRWIPTCTKPPNKQMNAVSSVNPEVFLFLWMFLGGLLVLRWSTLSIRTTETRSVISHYHL